MGDADGTDRRAGRWATVRAALGFVALVAATFVVALFTRSWAGLEAAVIPPLVAGIVVLAAWVSVLSVALVRGRRWATWATLVTFFLAAVATGTALSDTARRTLVHKTAPFGHLVLPALLFGTAALVVLLTIRDLATRDDDR